MTVLLAQYAFGGCLAISFYLPLPPQRKALSSVRRVGWPVCSDVATYTYAYISGCSFTQGPSFVRGNRMGGVPEHGLRARPRIVVISRPFDFNGQFSIIIVTASSMNIVEWDRPSKGFKKDSQTQQTHLFNKTMVCFSGGVVVWLYAVIRR